MSELIAACITVGVLLSVASDVNRMFARKARRRFSVAAQLEREFLEEVERRVNRKPVLTPKIPSASGVRLDRRKARSQTNANDTATHE
jgi:hypothetical protein